MEGEVGNIKGKRKKKRKERQNTEREFKKENDVKRREWKVM